MTAPSPTPYPTDVPWPEFAVRGLRGDLSRPQVFESEAAVLDGTIDSPVAQSYLTWRRSAMWVAALALAITVLANLVSWIGLLAQSDAEVAKEYGMPQGNPLIGEIRSIDVTLSTLLFLSGAGALAFLLRAALQWHQPSESRKSLRWSLALAVGIPLLCALVPWNGMIDTEALTAAGANAEQVKSFKTLIGLLVATALFTKVGPAVIGLCAGVIRASVTLKTMLPESFLPGWTLLAFAPVYGVMLVTVVVLVNQMNGDLLLLAGVGCLIASPMSYVFMAREILAPMAAGAASAQVQTAKSRAIGLYLVGSGLVTLWLFENTEVGFLDSMGFLFSAVGNALLISTAAADGQVSLIGSSWRQLEALKASDMANELDKKVEDLSAAGLT